MPTSFVFSEIAYSLGQHQISNNDILNCIKDSYLTDFDEERIIQSKDYKKALKSNPNLTPFFWLTEQVMGFKTRYHAVPFPPIATKYKHSESSIDLCVRAIEKLFNNSSIKPKDIDAWYVSCATPPHPAPSIADEIKSYFTNYDNNTPTYSLTSACVGFNINLELTINHFNANPTAKHIIVAHTELMSKLLLNEKNFVPYATFGDSASAVILSKIESNKKIGITSIENHEDMQMLDFLGADKNNNLYMDARRVKSRAVPNILSVFKSLADKNNWNEKNVKYYVPHQTGNAIVHSVAEKGELPKSKIYQEVQKEYGNLSGSSVPVCIAKLLSEGKIKSGDKIVSAVAGLGGEYGGFSYIVPDKEKHSINIDYKPLNNKTTLVTGATGGLGEAIINELAKLGSNIIIQYNSNKNKAEEIQNTITKKYNVKASVHKLDFSDNDSLKQFCMELKMIKPDYIIYSHAITGSLNKASNISYQEIENVFKVNYKAVKYISDGLIDTVKSCVIFIGSVGEDAQFPGSASYVASKRALRAYARGYSKDVYNNNIKCIYYIPGIIDGGMSDKLSPEQINASMMMIGQKEMIPIKDIAKRIAKSLYIPKILNVRDNFEDLLLVRKDGYTEY